MQDRYAGNIGDYVKLALLRALTPGRTLGVAWWLFPDGGPAGDGRHVDYLRHPATWGHYDSDLFDALHRLVTTGERSVAALERCVSVSDAAYHAEPIAVGVASVTRRAGLTAWFELCRAALDGCDLVFLDPDNGLEPSVYSTGSRQAAKAVGLEELKALRRPGRALVVYHHQTRRKGGHVAEIAHWADRLRYVGSTGSTRSAPERSPHAPCSCGTPTRTCAVAPKRSRGCGTRMSGGSPMVSTLPSVPRIVLVARTGDMT